MAKHPHRLILIQKKTWKCTLPGCSFFVHIGLAHVLIGKRAVCWECGEEFALDERALQDEMPNCLECRSTKLAQPSADELDIMLVQMKREKVENGNGE